MRNNMYNLYCMTLQLFKIGFPSDFDRCESIIANWSDTGTIGFSEFLSVFSLSYKTSSNSNDLKMAFRMLDRDGKGLVKVWCRKNVFVFRTIVFK